LLFTNLVAPTQDKFISGLTFQRNHNNCSSVEWKNNVETGLCSVSYEIQFVSGTSVTTHDNGDRTSYQSCNLSAESVLVTAVIYDINHKIMLANQT